MEKNPVLKLVLVTSAAMLAFAANSLLCRQALAAGTISAASFTLIRIVSGALMLAALTMGRSRQFSIGGSWVSAAALFGYAAAFSFAYNSLSAGTGALLLFGAVQVTMIVAGFWSGERMSAQQALGAVMAAGGLVWLLLPSVQSPPLMGAALMLAAGFSWGVYSLLGRGTQQPAVATAGNFIRAAPFAVVLFFLAEQPEHASGTGIGYAIASGALASGLGYALWYSVLPALPATTAATVQLSVPVVAALGGVVLLGEGFTLRFVIASAAVLGGIAIFVLRKAKREKQPGKP